MARRIVDVLLPVALDQPYSYRVPAGLALVPGDFVTVPLGRRAATAVVWADNPRPDPGLDNRIREVEDKLDIPPLKLELRRFVDWVASYTLAPRGMVLRMALRRGEHLGPSRERMGVRLVGPMPLRLTAARSRLLALLADGLARPRSQAAHDAGVSPGVVDSLLAEGTLEKVCRCRRNRWPRAPTPIIRHPTSCRRSMLQRRNCAPLSGEVAIPLRCWTA